MLFQLLMALISALVGGSPARPSAPAFSAAPGANDGEITLTVTALPSSWGGGSAGIIEWENPIDGWLTLSDPAATGASTKTLGASLWGTTVTIRVRGVSAAGVEGEVATATVAVPPSPAIGSIWPASGAWASGTWPS